MPQDPFIGQVIPWPIGFAPRGWSKCEGQLLAISQNDALFSIIGTFYGGDGRTTFALPDLRGRVAIHQGTGPGLGTYPLGNRGGVEEATVSTSELPVHSHAFGGLDVVATTLEGNQLIPGPTQRLSAGKVGSGQDLDMYTSAAPDTTLGGFNVSGSFTTGNNPGATGAAHANMQPFLVLCYIIALVGVFPSRS